MSANFKGSLYGLRGCGVLLAKIPEEFLATMKKILIVHNLLEGQKIVHELDDKDFAIELVEGETFDEDDNLDVESRLFYRLD